MNWEEQLGLKASALVGGLIGGIISLTFEKQLSFLRALVLVFAGGITSGYSFAFAHARLGIEDNVAGFFGFGLGLVAMKIIGAIISLADKIKEDPIILLSISRIWTQSKDGNITSTTTIDSGTNNNKPHIHVTRAESEKDSL